MGRVGVEKNAGKARSLEMPLKKMEIFGVGKASLWLYSVAQGGTSSRQWHSLFVSDYFVDNR